MPIYEYRCAACGHTLEALQKVSEAPLRECPSCSELELTRLMSAPSFRLKGGGWYETDFKSDKEKKRNLVERPDAGAASSADAKSDGAGGKDGAAKDGAAKDGAKAAEKPASKEPAKTAATEAKPAAKSAAKRSSESSAST